MVPDRVLFPTDDREVAEALRQAAIHRDQVIPVGGATMLDIGNKPAGYTVAVDTRALSGVVEYNPGDLTIVARAGTTLSVLQETVAENDQFLALDAPYPNIATVGGVLASNSTGPLRLAYGSPRDVVIGTRVALPGGEIARSGGKVVKNVAGYDLSKLFIGSYGTLGIIVEVAVRVSPRPQARRVFAVPAEDDPAGNNASRLVQSLGATVLCIAFVNAPLAATVGLGGASLVVVIGGLARTTDEVVERAGSLLAPRPVTVLAETHAADILARLRDLPGRATARVWSPDLSILTRFPAVESLEIVAYPTFHTAYVCAPRWSSDDFEAARALVNGERGQVAKLHGGPALDSVSTWGKVGLELSLMRAVKATFDPESVMSPGRFVGGI